VSPAVVSYTLNGGSRPVAAGTRERVLAAVRQLGYQPDAAARSLSSGRPGLVGLIVPEIQNPYFAWLGHAVEVAATERGLSVVFANSTDDSELRLVQALSGRLLTGLILATQPSMEATRQIISSGIAAVLVNQPRVSSVLPTLGPDYYGGTTEVVRHLAEVHGCRSIAFAGDPNASDDRQRAWRDTVAQLGLEQVDIIPTDYRLSGGHRAGRELLTRSELPDAVFAGSDQLAFGLLGALGEAGLRVPQDLRLGAFDGSPQSQFMIPPLTTAVVPMEAMARDAIEHLLGTGEAVYLSYPTRLAIRGSCGCDSGAAGPTPPG
jgi:LacI family transcriptional regulator